MYKIGTIINPPPTPNRPAVKPAIAPIIKYMINSINILPHFSDSNGFRDTIATADPQSSQSAS